jgi:hypothetical protein
MVDSACVCGLWFTDRTQHRNCSSFGGILVLDGSRGAYSLARRSKIDSTTEDEIEIGPRIAMNRKARERLHKESEPYERLGIVILSGKGHFSVKKRS